MKKTLTVNQTVNDILTEVQENYAHGSTEWKLFKFMEIANEKRTFPKSLGGWFLDNSITIECVIDALEIGWKLESNFEVGDVLWDLERETMSIVVAEKGDRLRNINSSRVLAEYANRFSEVYVLICKAKDRMDLV